MYKRQGRLPEWFLCEQWANVAVETVRCRGSGWHEIARVSFDLGDMHLDEIVFVGPTT